MAAVALLTVASLRAQNPAANLKDGASPARPLPSAVPPSSAAPTKSDPMIANALAEAVKPAGTCVQPESVFDIQDYNGPLSKLVIRMAGQPDIKTVHAPHSKAGSVLCSLHTGEKFKLFVQETFEPDTFIIVGFNAGLAQASNDDPKFGQGAEGYGRRYGAAFADQVVTTRAGLPSTYVSARVVSGSADL